MPALDQPPQREGGGLTARVGAVEHRPVEQLAFVMDGDHVGEGRLLGRCKIPHPAPAQPALGRIPAVLRLEPEQIELLLGMPYI